MDRRPPPLPLLLLLLPLVLALSLCASCASAASAATVRVELVGAYAALPAAGAGAAYSDALGKRPLQAAANGELVVACEDLPEAAGDVAVVYVVSAQGYAQCDLRAKADVRYERALVCRRGLPARLALTPYDPNGPAAAFDRYDFKVSAGRGGEVGRWGGGRRAAGGGGTGRRP